MGWGENESLGIAASYRPVVLAQMIRVVTCEGGYLWNDECKGKPKYSEKTCLNVIHYKPHMDCPGIELGPPRREADD